MGGSECLVLGGFLVPQGLRPTQRAGFLYVWQVPGAAERVRYPLHAHVQAFELGCHYGGAHGHHLAVHHVTERDGSAL